MDNNNTYFLSFLHEYTYGTSSSQMLGPGLLPGDDVWLGKARQKEAVGKPGAGGAMQNYVWKCSRGAGCSQKSWIDMRNLGVG